MGIDFRRKQTLERKYGIRVINPAGRVPDRVLLQRNQVVRDGFLEAGGREKRLTPGLGKGDACLGGCQVPERPHAACLVQNPAIGVIITAGSQILSGESPEILQSETPDRLLLYAGQVEGDIGPHGANIHVLFIRKASAPHRPPVAELAVVQISDGFLHVWNSNAPIAEHGEAFQQGGRHNRGGVHALRPGETAVILTERQKRCQRAGRIPPQQRSGVEVGRAREGVRIFGRSPLFKAGFRHFTEHTERHFRLVAGKVDKHTAERIDCLRPSEGRMALRKRLFGSVHRDGNAHSVGETIALEHESKVQLRVIPPTDEGRLEGGRRRYGEQGGGRASGRDGQFRGLSIRRLPLLHGIVHLYPEIQTARQSLI